MAEPDFYAALGIKRDADQDEIKAAYRRLARRYHPDVNKAEDAATKFAQIQNAYDTLSDPEKRRQYDRLGHDVFTRGGSGPTYSWTNVGGGGPTDFDFGDLGSMFDAFFTGRDQPAAGGRRRGHAPRAPRRPGRDLRRVVEVDFERAARGARVDVPAAQPGRTLTVNIPPATASGAKLRLAGEGEPAPSPGSRPGDLIVEIRVRPHPLLRRGTPAPLGVAADDTTLDLWLELPVTLAEATLGAAVDIPTLDGPIALRIPPGSASGTRLRLRGRGLAAPGRDPGHLYAVLKVVPPDPANLDQAAADQLRAIAGDPVAVRDGAAWADTLTSKRRADSDR